MTIPAEDITESQRNEGIIENGFARMCLNLRTKHNVTHTAINVLVTYLSDVLKDANFLEMPLTGVISSLSSLKTQKQRTNYCKKPFFFSRAKGINSGNSSVGCKTGELELEPSNYISHFSVYFS